MKKTIILGGGTAGLVSALILKKAFPLDTITIIESDEIGIVGVGEGSTEHWRNFLEFCEIDTATLVRDTDATLKKGIKFENWNGDGKSYFHALAEPFYTEYSRAYPSGNTFIRTLIAHDIKTQELLTDTNLIYYNGGIRSTNQYQFNTFKLNAFLHKVAAERGVEIVKDTISDVQLNSVGDVESLLGSEGVVYRADLFIDSSGFKRVISSKLGAKWVSYKKYLPMNHALAFPTEDVSDLKAYTLSRALSSGWNWRIPTQSRYGNGYVFCDEFQTSEQALAEVQSFYSEEVKVVKDIKFEAGRVDQFWINNCVSVGLSASFVEPLEATSIGNSILQAFGLVEMLQTWYYDRGVANIYNKKFIGCFDNIVDFVQLHYVTKREDTEFWRTIKNTMVMTDFNAANLETFKKAIPCQQYFGGYHQFNMFNAPNYIQVMHGLEMFDLDAIREYNKTYMSQETVNKELETYNKHLENLKKESLIEHKVLLEQNRYVLQFEPQ
jgi:tryptophan halogenase